MFAARTTMRHLSISDAMYAPNSSGVNTIGAVEGRGYVLSLGFRAAL